MKIVQVLRFDIYLQLLDVIKYVFQRMQIASRYSHCGATHCSNRLKFWTSNFP